MNEKNIKKEEADQIIRLVVDAMLKQIMVSTTPSDWAKAGGARLDTLPVTLHFPEKFVEYILSSPGGEATLNLFVTLAISFYVTAKADAIVEDLEEKIKDLLKDKAKSEETHMIH